MPEALFLDLFSTKSGKLAIFASIFVGGRRVGYIAIENLVDGLGQ